MNKDAVKLVVSFNINDVETFSKVAHECATYVAEHEKGTLVYDWYLDAACSSGTLFEIYESTQAFRTHLLGPVFKDIGPKFHQSITWVRVDSFGDLPEEYHNILGSLPSTNWPVPTIAAK